MMRSHWKAEVRLILSQISQLEMSSPSFLSTGSRVEQRLQELSQPET